MEKSLERRQASTCPMCPFSTDDLENLQNHIEDDHFAEQNQQAVTDIPKRRCISIPISKEDEIFTCPLCSFNSSDYHTLDTHIQQHDLSTPTKDARCVFVKEGCNACPICQMSNFDNEIDLHIHIEHHFSEQASFQNTSSKHKECDLHWKEREAEEKLEFRKLQMQFGFHENQDVGCHRDNALVKAVQESQMTVAEYHETRIRQKISESRGLDDGSSVTNDLPQRVRELGSNNHRVKRILVCSSMDHYGASFGDKGWGCGYRNLQMILSSLYRNPLYALRLKNLCNGVVGDTKPNQRVSVPSISRLQRAIEESWKLGFDAQGCEQLGGKLYNTRKWIGATEVVSLLSSNYIRCQLIDFWQPTSPNGTHPALFNWVWEYFNKQAEYKPPLYLQHQGHSRTIIGTEQLSDSSFRLLIADPGHTQKQMNRLFQSAAPSINLKILRNPLASLKYDQYQIVCIDGILTEEEYESCKQIRSTRVPPE